MYQGCRRNNLQQSKGTPRTMWKRCPNNLNFHVCDPHRSEAVNIVIFDTKLRGLPLMALNFPLDLTYLPLSLYARIYKFSTQITLWLNYLVRLVDPTLVKSIDSCLKSKHSLRDIIQLRIQIVSNYKSSYNT